MDPKLRVLGDGVGAATTADALIFFNGGAQRAGLVDLGLLKGQSQQCPRSVPLRRRQKR